MTRHSEIKTKKEQRRSKNATNTRRFEERKKWTVNKNKDSDRRVIILIYLFIYLFITTQQKDQSPLTLSVKCSHKE